MTQIILDASATIRLGRVREPVQICDSEGHIIGQFIPLLNMSDWEPASPDISEDELERRSKSDEKRYTTAEVLAHLEKS
jgi:hypothetical protein